MTEPLRLSGGEVFRNNPDVVKLSPSADKPNIRAWWPGTILVSAGSKSQLDFCARTMNIAPAVTELEPFARKLPNGEKYIGLAPKILEPQHARPLRFDAGSQAGYITGMREMLELAGIRLDEDLVYRMDSQLAVDEDFGHCVVALWTKATTSIREKGSSRSQGQNGQKEAKGEGEGKNQGSAQSDAKVGAAQSDAQSEPAPQVPDPVAAAKLPEEPADA